MKKLSNIIESFWGDVHKRSRGDEIRKEDNIDTYDIETFCEYIKKIYTLIRNSEEYIYVSTSVPSNPYILLPIEGLTKDSDCLRLYGYGQGEESIKNIFIEDWEQFTKNNLKKLENLLGDEYTIIHNEPHFYGEIKKKSDGEITNSETIDIIDKILSVVKRPLLKKVSGVTESFWGDVHKRSRGDEIRKEDDINHMDIYEFWEYLHNTYISQHPDRDVIDYPIDGAISMPFCMKNELNMYMLWIEFNDFNNHKIERISLPDVTVSKYEGIEDVFNLKGYSGERRICICPKDGSEITNLFAVKVIDYLLDQAVDDRYRMFIKKERS